VTLDCFTLQHVTDVVNTLLHAVSYLLPEALMLRVMSRH
jgi:hypothetical protein